MLPKQAGTKEHTANEHVIAETIVAQLYCHLIPTFGWFYGHVSLACTGDNSVGEPRRPRYVHG